MSEGSIFRLAAGQSNRDYSSFFIASDVGAMGPAVGDWNEERESERGASLTSRKRSSLDSFAGVKEGDLILLAVGYRPLTIGRVAKDQITGQEYKYEPRIGLFGNWDLFNVIRVKWASPDNDSVKDALDRLRKDYGPVRLRSSFSGINVSEVRECIRKLDDRLDREGVWDRELIDAVFNDEPVDGPQDLESFRGLASDVKDPLMEAIANAKGLWGDVQSRHWDPHPSENEAVALIVVPFLLALGWRPGQIALEWHRVDVAAFPSLARTEPVLMVEAKRPGSGLDWAKGQADRYARENSLSCPIITTDGFSWALFANNEATKAEGQVFLPEIYQTADGFFRALDDLHLIPHNQP